MRKLELEEADFLFRCPALADPTLRVYRFSGREALNQPLRFTIELVSADPNLDLDAPIGQPARLTLRGRHPGGGALCAAGAWGHRAPRSAVGRSPL